MFARDRTFSLQCLEKHDELSADLSGPPRNIALFTDTFHEINGVATSIRTQADAARLTKQPLTVINCGSSAESSLNVAAFQPIGAFDLPEYPELKLYYPPVLNILSYCYQERFTHIQAETPGTMGLTALLISCFLNLPFRGAYHTSLPQTIGAVMDDSHKEKNLHIFKTIIQEILRIRDDVCLIIIGEGPYLPELRKQLQGLPVVFTGYLHGEELAQAYASSDIFVFPSTVDTLGTVVLEAQASGLPVLVTDQGGPAENMLDQETGFVIPADDKMPEKFAEAILKLFDNPELLSSMQQKARTSIQKKSSGASSLESREAKTSL